MWRPRPLAGAWTPPQARAAAVLPAARRLAVASGNGLGKTHLLADLVGSFVADYPDAQVMVTAPTGHQLIDLLWPAIYDRLRRLNLWQNELDGNYKRWQLGARGITSIATNKPARLQGKHAPHLLVICDEASGLRSDLLAALLGCAVGADNWVVLLGNPNEARGALWDAMGAASFATCTLSALEHPNVLARADVIPGAVTWPSICQMLKDWCRELPAPEPTLSFALDVPAVDVPAMDGWTGSQPRHWLPNDEFRVRVLGLWPRTPGSCLFSQTDLAAAADAGSIGAEIDHHAALDVARFGGDSTTWAERRGATIIALEVWPAATIPATAARAIAAARERGIHSLTIDCAGLGVGVYDLCQVDPPCAVRRFVGADPPVSPADASRYLNRRSASFARTAQAARAAALSLPNDPDLLAELAAITYHHDAQGRMVIIPKEELRRELGRSTDRADAVTMLWDVPPAAPPAARRARRRTEEAEW